MSEDIHHVYGNWKTEWQSKRFRWKLLIGFILNLVVLACVPYILEYVQARNGAVLNDWLVNKIPPHNMSAPLIFFIWGSMILFILMSVRNPDTVIIFLYSYAFLTTMRMTSIYLVPLNPPPHWIEIYDPISDLLYVNGFKTKDLFFSGHASTIVLFGLCLTQKPYKIILFGVSAAVACLVLIQHVHYTIDVVAAPFFAYLAFFITIKSGIAKHFGKPKTEGKIKSAF